MHENVRVRNLRFGFTQTLNPNLQWGSCSMVWPNQTPNIMFGSGSNIVRNVRNRTAASLCLIVKDIPSSILFHPENPTTFTPSGLLTTSHVPAALSVAKSSWMAYSHSGQSSCFWASAKLQSSKALALLVSATRAYSSTHSSTLDIQSLLGCCTLGANIDIPTTIFLLRDRKIF